MEGESQNGASATPSKELAVASHEVEEEEPMVEPGSAQRGKRKRPLHSEHSLPSAKRPLFTRLMNSSFSLGFFTFFRKFRFRQDNKEINSSSSSSSSSLLPSPSSLSPSSVLRSSSSQNWTHQVFPSFRGEDVRRDFLSHIQKEFKRKGITPFIDNEIQRGEFIGPELISAIRASKIAVVLFSVNYASSKWCLDELVEIMKCSEELGLTVIPIFYKVDPSDVKKLTGDFGSIFLNSCVGKTSEVISGWRLALAKVATIAGYDSRNWYNEAAMIENIVIDILNKLTNSIPSSDFDGLVGMGAHMKNMESMLCLDSDEVRMVGIWGPSGIGKTTIARFLFEQLSNSFDLSAFMEDLKGYMYARPMLSDDYSEKLHLHKQFLSQITNHKDIEVPHLGVAQYMLHDKKVIVVLDNIDRSIYLDAIAKEIQWFGPGSRIIITTQDKKLLKAHRINHIYKVDYPSTYEACQIFCMYAFGQKFPEEGFEELAWEVTLLLGKLPLGLRVMGSYFRGRSKQEWTNALPRLRICLDEDIESILKFSYDALENAEKDLFLHIACFFNGESTETLEAILAKDFFNVRHILDILAEKSLISPDYRMIEMHNLLVQLGRKIVRCELGQESIHELGKRQFLVNAKEICEVLADDTSDSRNVIGIFGNLSKIEYKLNVSARALKKMSNLKFLRLDCEYGYSNRLYSLQSLKYLSRKLRILEWTRFPMTCLPSNFSTEYLVKIDLHFSKLQKLWESKKPLGNLKWMDFYGSENLEELPDLSTATNLQKVNLTGCSSLVELPSSIENAINLKILILYGCSSLVELPSSIENATNLVHLNLIWCSSLVELPHSIGNAINLHDLHLNNCTGLVELPHSIGNAINLVNLSLNMCTGLVELPSSIGNLQKLYYLSLKGCSKLEILPININLESLEKLVLIDCSRLKSFPEISTNIKYLELTGTAIKEVPLSIKSWSRLDYLSMSYSENLKNFPHALNIITILHLYDTEIQEIHPWVMKTSRLTELMLNKCKKLVSLSQISDSLSYLDASNCESLEILDCSFNNPNIYLNFTNCLKLNKEARELIIKTSSKCAVLPGGEVPAHFTYQATNGSSMRVSFNQRPLSSTWRFKACIKLVDKGVDGAGDGNRVDVYHRIIYKHNGITLCDEAANKVLPVLLSEHLYIIEVETKAAFTEIEFTFVVKSDKWGIGEGGVLQLPDKDKH